MSTHRLRNTLALKSGVQENSRLLARRSLLVCAVLALLGSLASIPEIARGQMFGAPKYLLSSSVVVEVGVVLTLLFFRRVRPELLAVAASVYFGVYLSAGCVVCIHDKRQAGYVLLFFLWFSPLLVFNRLVNRPALASIFNKLFLVVPLGIVLASWVPLKHALAGQTLFLLVNLALSHLMLGLILEPLTRYRAAYTLEKSRVESMLAEAELVERTAYHDALTGLPNRAAVKRQLKRALHDPDSGTVGLLLIDLDNFRTLNDALGHAVGDLLLQQVAVRLAAVAGPGEAVAHMGGDEFALILENIKVDPDDARKQVSEVCSRVCGVFQEAFKAEEHECLTSASAGVSLSFPGATAEDLLKRADLALAHAKSCGRNCARQFAPDMEAQLAARATLARDLRRALAQGEFSLVYQPQIDVQGYLIGAEALIRWCHPIRGWIPPSEFIPLAEEAGLIGLIGKWVLEAASSQLAVWSVAPRLNDLTLSVNVSVRQLVDPRFVQDIEEVLLRNRLNSHRLKLEITESAVMEQVEESIARMVELRTKGIRFSLDDFGTGHSSLSYLKRLPLDQLKVDRSFVTGVTGNEADASIARTVILLAQSLGIEVIAEGVETESQRSFLAENGCHRYQGYLFSRPLTPVQLEQFVANGAGLVQARVLPHDLWDPFQTVASQQDLAVIC